MRTQQRSGVEAMRNATVGRRSAAGWRRWSIVGVALVSLSAAACSDDDGTGPAASVEEQRAFIDGIVPHHQAASMMADDAIAKATRAWVRTLAQTMKADQNREIAQYKAIRQRILGSSETPEAMMMQPTPAGPDFDREWLMMMIEHHQGAIDISTLAHGSSVRSTLDSLAHHTIEEQKKEQQEMRDSLRTVFGAGT